MHPAAAARRNKEANPERYCPNERCLWNTGRSGPCPKHQGGSQELEPWPDPPAPELHKDCEICERHPAAHRVHWSRGVYQEFADICCACDNCEGGCSPFVLLKPGEPDPRD